MKTQRTFHEDVDMSIVMNWIDGAVWLHTYQTTPRDPAEIECRLSKKIKITVEVFGEDKSISIDQYMQMNPEIDPHEQTEEDNQ